MFAVLMTKEITQVSLHTGSLLSFKGITSDLTEIQEQISSVGSMKIAAEGVLTLPRSSDAMCSAIYMTQRQRSRLFLFNL